MSRSKPIWTVLATVLALLALGRPAGARSGPTTTERPAGEDASRSSATPRADEADRGRAEPPEPAGEIGLREALALTLAHSPELVSYSWSVRAAEARVLQAGLSPNPALDLEVEDVGVSGATRGVDQSELTVALSQLLEMGGKRAARIEFASRERELAGWDYEVARMDVLTRTAQLFVALLVAQSELELADESVRLAREVVDAAATRVEAGSTSSVELTKAEVALASAGVAREEALRALESARKQLAASWGGTAARFTRATGTLDDVVELPSLAELQRSIESNPELARWASELERRRAAVDLEEAQAVPDVTVRGGYRRLFDPDENTFVVGVSVPLPLANRNEGAILEAQSRLEQARADRRITAVRVATALAEAYQSLATARAQVEALEDRVLPGATRAFRTLNEGYREGRFSYLDVLDAQRTLIAVRAQLVRALGDYHRGLAAVERLVGAPVGAMREPAARDARG